MVATVHRHTLINIAWVHYTLVATSFISVVVVLGMCMCKRWRKRRDSDEEFPYYDYKNIDGVSEVGLDARRCSSDTFGSKDTVASTSTYDHMNPSHLHPPLRKTDITPQQQLQQKQQQLSHQLAAGCFIKLENIQPAYEDEFAYERLRAGKVTLPDHLPQAPTDLSEDLGVIYFSISYDIFAQVLRLFVDKAEGGYNMYMKYEEVRYITNP